VVAGAAVAAALPHADAQTDTAPATTEPSLTPAQELAQYLDLLASNLNQGPQSQRDEAAQRLIEIGTPETETIILNALGGNDERAQNAGARAIAHGRVLDPRWLDPLVQLLGNDHTVDSAAHALVRYDNSPRAYEPLVRLARSRQQAARTGIIDALGQVVQKPVAEELAGLVGDATEDADIRSAAAESLQSLSGQFALGGDPQKWQAWWNARLGANPTDWRTQVLAEQHPALERLESGDRERLRQLKTSMDNILARQYDRQPPAEKPLMLISLLNDPNPDVRKAGVDLVSSAVGAGQPIPKEIHARLIHLVGDAAPDVRDQSVRVLRSLGESNALDAILVQLQVEPTPQVKLDLLQALAQLDGAKSIPVVEQLLSDPSLEVAAEAARTLRALAKSIRANPAESKQVFDQLQKLMEDRTGTPGMPNNGPGSSELRAAMVSAMAQLSGDAPLEAFDLFQRLLDPNEQPPVRQAAVEGLPAAGERAGDYIARELDLTNEPDSSVRREAAISLGKLGSFTYARQLDNASRKQYEPEEKVREAAWKGFQSLLPAASTRDLEQWADLFHREPVPNGQPAIPKEERELAVRMELASKDQRAGDLQSLALEQQRIGELYTSLTPPQYSNAARYLRLALNYWEGVQAQQTVVAQLVRELEDSLLRSGQYRDAIQFGAKEIANQDVIYSSIRNVVEELMDQGKNGDPAAYKSASDLISEALKKDSPLDSNQRFQLDEIRKNIPTTP
jgi:HEAT repeat protein